MPPLQPGQTFRFERACDPYRPIYYAAASGDFNPIHIDPEAGRASGLGGSILQGLCTLSWAVEAAVDVLGDPDRLRTFSCRFSRPVAPGDVVTFTSTVAAAEGDAVKLRILGQNQRGEDVLKAGVAEGGPARPPLGLERPAAARTYAAARYQVGAQKAREFALAIGGGVPSHSFPLSAVPDTVRPCYLDGTRLPPSFCVAFNLKPFGDAMVDPALQVDVPMLVHGEQTFELLEPVRPGDTLETDGYVAERFTKAGKQFLSVVAESRRDGKLVVRGTYTAVIRPR
jgi:acyl dehydratase